MSPRPLALCACALLALAAGCFARPAKQEVYEEGGIRVFLRSDVRWRSTVEKGYEHPVAIAPVRLAHVLSRLDLRPPQGWLFGDSKERVPAIETEMLFSVAEGISEALARADADQEVVVMALKETKRWGIFDHDYLTSLVVYARDERLYLHFSRFDWEVPRRSERLPEPRVGHHPQRFRLYPGTAMALLDDQSVAVDWRDPVFAQPTRTRVLPGGDVVRKEILLESPPEVDPGRDALGDPLRRLPDDLSPEQLRALADLEEARRQGRITEAEYRSRRREILAPEG